MSALGSIIPIHHPVLDGLGHVGWLDPGIIIYFATNFDINYLYNNTESN
jgi:hypothetical protein